MITLKTKEEIEIMKEGGRILARIMERLKREAKEGVRTDYLEKLAQKLIKKAGAKPAFLGYEGFPAVLCVSINEELVHCLPSKRKLKKGDLLSLDLGICWKGYFCDMARSFVVGGTASPEVLRLVRVTKKALKLAIKKAKIGNTIGDIGNTIQRYVEGRGFSVVKSLCGHGIGKKLHEDPKILNYGKRKKGAKIKEGMVFCIEPMVTMGKGEVKLKGKFCFVTKDGSLSCHFEDQVAIVNGKAQVLTKL